MNSTVESIFNIFLWIKWFWSREQCINIAWTVTLSPKAETRAGKKKKRERRKCEMTKRRRRISWIQTLPLAEKFLRPNLFKSLIHKFLFIYLFCERKREREREREPLVHMLNGGINGTQITEVIIQKSILCH